MGGGLGTEKSAGAADSKDLDRIGQEAEQLLLDTRHLIQHLQSLIDKARELIRSRRE